MISSSLFIWRSVESDYVSCAILEPESLNLKPEICMTDWNQCYAESLTPWDKGQPSPPLVQYLTERPLKGRVLQPGCGVGHDVAWLDAQGLQVTGLDLSPLAIERAQKAHPEVPENAWLPGDLFDLPQTHAGAFDAVVEHTCLCAMPPALRTRYRDAVHALLKPGGLLVGVWFINPDMDPGEEGPPFGIALVEMDALFDEGFNVEEDYTPDVAFDGRLGRERIRVLRKV
jgi:SAM-dependent methyltransferase